MSDPSFEYTAESTAGGGFYFHRASGPAPNQSAAHRHGTLEIYYIREGTCRYEIAGKPFDLTAGDLLLIPAGITHKTDRYSRLYTRLLINCTEDYVPPSVRPLLGTEPCLYRDAAVTEEADRILSGIEREYRLGDALSGDLLRCRTGELLILLARSKSSERTESARSPVESTVLYIREHYMNEISLPMLAKLHSITPDHLSRTFKKETGYGISEYLTLVRLQKAEFMLKNEPGRTVSEIAFACGFNDSNYFSDKFKKVYGVTPSSVRKRAGKQDA